jgi:hypothetical protein
MERGIHQGNAPKLRCGSMSYRGDLRKLISRLEIQGWRVEKRKKHWLAFPANREQRPVRLAGTPSSAATWRNQLAELKRKGYRD